MNGPAPTTSSEVVFGELPGGEPKPRYDWSPVARVLRARPGEWAKIAARASQPSASGVANSVRQGRYLAFQPSGAFEAVSRGTDVWARFVGESP